MSKEAHAKMTQEVLHAVGTVFDKYAVFPTREARDTVVLWVLHSYVYKRFDATPRLSLYSSEPGSGKSRVMDLVAGLAPAAVNAVNVRPSILYQTIEAHDQVVMTIDEVDRIFGKRGSNSSHRQLQAILNEGFTCEGMTQVTNGPETVRGVSLYCPVVMAGMGSLPDATQSRSIRIKMVRRSGVDLEPFRIRKSRHEFGVIRAALTEWAREVGRYLELIYPELPVDDRDADKWEPLITIAEMAGTDWLRRGIQACRLLESNEDNSTDELPLSVKLLRDLDEIIEERQLTSADKVFTTDLVAELVSRGWDEAYVNPRSLARVLGEYNVEPTTVRRGEEVAKGYLVAELEVAISAM